VRRHTIPGRVGEFEHAGAELRDELRCLIAVGKDDDTELLFGQQREVRLMLFTPL